MPSKPSPVGLYLRAVSKNLAQGDATEHTHRPALKALLEALGGPGLTATNEPKRIKCGAPDFRVVRRKVPLGHVETKDVGVVLDEVASGRGPHGEQFIRYRDGLPNWILTNYHEFRWFVAGQLRLCVCLADRDGKGRLVERSDGEKDLIALFRGFCSEQAPTVATSKELAERLAGMTRIVRELILGTLRFEPPGGWLHKWLVAFRDVLIPELTAEEFSDMFAQTIAYGLFAARLHSREETFSREHAAYSLPKTNPFLRKLFAEVAGVDMPETLDWAVDDIVDMLSRFDASSVLKQFGMGRGKEDPVVHFYETFLAAYDPRLREVRGVYFTPEPVVGYIVRSLDHLLKTRFDRPKGLADQNTLILDPAVGTATFLFSVLRLVHGTFAKQRGAWDAYVEKHLLNRVFGFELLMAPYAVAHLKLGLQLQATGYKFKLDQRLGIYLTNTLEQQAAVYGERFASWVSDEANDATSIKRERPILVVLGNPPYSGHSANRSRDEKGNLTFIGGLIEDYKRDCPELRKPAQAKWLHDDYVKFIRFAQWRIAQTGEGVVGFITNHGYLDNPTFRGMRRSLLGEFAEIWVYDLHGNTKKKERAPSGEADKNVFDIQQGVSILLCVKTRGAAGPAVVRHAELWGARAHKYEVLESNSVATTGWAELRPSAPAFKFVPEDAELRAEFDACWKITDVFGENGDPAPGVVTTQDEFAIAFSAEEMRQKVEALLATNSEAEARRLFRLCSTTQWDYETAKRELAKGEWRSQVTPILYRPFDTRFTVFNRYVAVHRRERVMRHMLAGENLGLATARANRSAQMNHFMCTDRMTETKCAESTIQSYLLPLYLYPDEEALQGSLLAADERRANIAPRFVADLSGRLGLKWVGVGRGDGKKTVGPEDVFHYAYAMFHSPTYRARYAEFLKTEFPRLPLTADKGLFWRLASLGNEVVDLHLLRGTTGEDFATEFAKSGTNEVERVRYEAKDSRVWINDGQYFGGVTAAVWGFEVGGYPVCEKWLKHRKGRTLTYDDLQHFQRVVASLAETIVLMEAIDAAIPRWPLE